MCDHEIPKNRSPSANILRESCVCLGVSGALNDEKRSSETHRTETVSLKEGCDERRMLDIYFGLPRCEALRPTFGESAAALSKALLTPGPFRTSIEDSEGPVSTTTGPCCFDGSVAETD